MWDRGCAHATTAENDKRKETANIAPTRVENIASSRAKLQRTCAAQSYN